MLGDLNLSLPSTSTGADRLSSTGPVLVSWSPSATNETDGLSPLIFHDTGGTTGGETHLPIDQEPSSSTFSAHGLR